MPQQAGGAVRRRVVAHAYGPLGDSRKVEEVEEEEEEEEEEEGRRKRRRRRRI